MRTFNNNTIYRRDDWSRILETHRAKVESTDGDGPGYLEGYLAVFGNVDQGGERILKGAFARSIADRVATRKVPLMVRHFAYGGDTEDVVGTIVEAREDEFGLWIKAEFANTTKAQQVRQLVVDGHLWGLSVGYVPVRYQEVKEDDRYIVEHLEMKLVEGTITVRPMNESAIITSAKSLRDMLPSPEALTVQSAAASAKRLRDMLDQFLTTQQSTESPGASTAQPDGVAAKTRLHEMELALELQALEISNL